MRHSHMKGRVSIGSDMLGILTEVLFVSGMILVALLISCLFFLRR